MKGLDHQVIGLILVIASAALLLHWSIYPQFWQRRNVRNDISYTEDNFASLQSVFQGFPEVNLLLTTGSQSATVPTVLAPGMGDSCFNPGFSQLTSLVAKRSGQESFCYGPGTDAASDPINSFTKIMDEQVEHFASKVRSNEKLIHGFNAMGLSQVQRYNNPPVLNFVSVHGPHAGVASIPRCDPGYNAILKELCELLDYLLGDFVYTPVIQSSIAQSNFFRDPLKITQYLHGCFFLPNILDKADEQSKSRFTKLQHLALVAAERDTMIFPKETAHFGAFANGGWRRIIPAAQQPWYDLIGLKDLDSSGRLSLLFTPGDHLRFSQADLNEWVDKFFM